MAAVCVLALAFVLLLPLTQSHGDGAPGPAGRGTARGTQTRAGQCDDATAQDQSLAPSGAGGQTVAAIEERGYLRVGVDQNSYRWGYLNPNNPSGKLEGFDIDLAYAIAKDIFGGADYQQKIHFQAIPTDQRVPAIQNDQVDMVVRTMTITCDRLEDVRFSAPYFRTGQQVLAPRNSAITGYDGTLAGQRVCTAATSTAYDKITADRQAGRIPSSTKIVTVPNQLDCLVRLQLGEADAVVTDGALAASQAAQDPTVELKGTSFTSEYYGVAMKLTAGDLVRRVNRTLEEYRSSGGWKDSYDKWLSPTLGEDSDSANPPEAHYR
ncbi:glutamate ABC transporter substrate-binding protein [Streptomyces sp. NPDC047000]|uniref:glutamate ABC transporter substrate-binding protein n=1 Tax=Streptomyces sp. NPDC047000 TaxID=3155474 RepID=UPI0033CEB310